MPWEFLYDPDNRFFLAASGQCTLGRRLELRTGTSEELPTLPLKVLVVMAQPWDQPEYGRFRARRQVEDGLKGVRGKEVWVEFLDRPTLASLTERLVDGGFRVVHFIGHGGENSRGEPLLAFEDDYGGTDFVNTERLRQALQGRGVRLVFLQACFSGAAPWNDTFAGVTQGLLEAGMPGVVSMQASVLVEAANAFTRRFYQLLSQGEAVDLAVSEARNALLVSRRGEWGVPVAYIQTEAMPLVAEGEGELQPELSSLADNLAEAELFRAPGFVGRAGKLIELAWALRSPESEVRFVILVGAGGIGKTALAIESANWHQERRCFPDGIVWASAREEGSSLDTLLNKVATVLRIPEFHTKPTDEKAGLVRHLLTERELLLLIDNADRLKEEQSFRDFLRALPVEKKGSVLLTSRSAMNVPGERTVGLGILSLLEGTKLFELNWGLGERLSREELAAQRVHIAKICGHGLLDGHALAIKLTAAEARKEGLVNLEGLVERLRERMAEVLAQQPLPEEPSVVASLGMSYGALSLEAKSLFARLAVYHGPFREEAIQAVGEGLLSDVRRCWVELLELLLLERPEERFIIHPVVKAYAYSLLPEEERRDVHAAAGRFLVRTEYLQEHLEGMARLEVVQAFQEHLEGIDQLEAAQAWEDVISAVDRVEEFLNKLGFWDIRIRKLEQSLRACRKIGNQRLAAGALGRLGATYLSSRRFGPAIEYGQQALAAARETGDRHLEGIALGSLGNVYFRSGQFGEAIRNHQQALRAAQEVRDSHMKASALGNLGAAYSALKCFDNALKYLEDAVLEWKAIGDCHGEGIDLCNMGTVYRLQGQHDRAISCHKQALGIARETWDRGQEWNCLRNLSEDYHLLDQERNRIAYRQEALACAWETGDPWMVGSSLADLGEAYMNCNDWQRFLACSVRGLELLRTVSGPVELMSEIGFVRLRGDMGEEAFSKMVEELKPRIGLIIEAEVAAGAAKLERGRGSGG